MKKKTFLNGHCPFRGGGGRPMPGWFGPFFGRQKRHLGAYYRIKFYLKMTTKMMMIMVIILMMTMPKTPQLP